MALGGVLTGRAIAIEQAKAIETIKDTAEPRSIPITRIKGAIRAAVAVLLINVESITAIAEKANINKTIPIEPYPIKPTIQLSRAVEDIAFPKDKPPPMRRSTSQFNSARSSLPRRPVLKKAIGGISAIKPGCLNRSPTTSIDEANQSITVNIKMSNTNACIFEKSSLLSSISNFILLLEGLKEK